MFELSRHRLDTRDACVGPALECPPEAMDAMDHHCHAPSSELERSMWQLDTRDARGAPLRAALRRPSQGRPPHGVDDDDDADDDDDGDDGE